MTHRTIIAQELKSKGFEVAIKSNGVEVSLNRPVNTMEVEFALSTTFEEIEFKLRTVGDKVMVR